MSCQLSLKLSRLLGYKLMGEVSKYSSYQLNQFVLKVFKQFKKHDPSVNLAVVNQDEIHNFFIRVGDTDVEVVMIMIVTGSLIGRKEIRFYFDINGDFCYIAQGEVEGYKLLG